MASESELKIASLLERIEHIDSQAMELLTIEANEIEAMIHEYIETQSLDISDPKRVAIVVGCLTMVHSMIEQNLAKDFIDG